MIRNGLIDAQKEFAQRRYNAETDRDFEKIKVEVMQKHGVDIECCRAVWHESQKKIFALVDDILVNTISKPHVIKPWVAA